MHPKVATARWLVVSTFGSAELAERAAARVRGMHARSAAPQTTAAPYSAGDPDLLRWVHRAFTDAFLAAQGAVGQDMSRFGRHFAMPMSESGPAAPGRSAPTTCPPQNRTWPRR